ncbi:MAG TPA: DUF1287 domain-containing protein [Pyrinomonadaceae bacterium]|nr:DUF1287 domain-containing protein [Pyrinomonadaceae bacterium]
MKFAVIFFALFIFSCQTDSIIDHQITPIEPAKTPRIAEITSPEIKKLLESANEQIKVTRNYTQDYFVIPYPNGDVPIETGACTDVIVRAFRNVGIDLQKEVHEDMKANFALYPTKWGMDRTDPNIDHRRVLNLQTFFTRRGKSLPITDKAKNYKPGDIVSWDLNGKGMTHIGIVSNQWNENTKRFSIIHNIGGGTNQEDRLFDWKITGHYRYF